MPARLPSHTDYPSNNNAKELCTHVITLLEKRYLQPGETPEGMFRRVADAVAKAEWNYGTDRQLDNRIAQMDGFANETYQAMLAGDFMPNSPALMNAGTKSQVLSACFVWEVPDTITDIFGAVQTAARVVQSGGGLGLNFSDLRSAGSPVVTSSGVSSGPCSFIRNFDVMADVVKQGGKRRAALLGLLNINHPDILEWIRMKDQDGYLPNFNISVGITDEFMLAVKENREYELIDPHTKQVTKTLPARLVWDEIIDHAHKNGEPGVVFLGTIEKGNRTPELGPLLDNLRLQLTSRRSPRAETQALLSPNDLKTSRRSPIFRRTNPPIQQGKMGVKYKKPKSGANWHLGATVNKEIAESLRN